MIWFALIALAVVGLAGVYFRDLRAFHKADQEEADWPLDDPSTD